MADVELDGGDGGVGGGGDEARPVVGGCGAADLDVGPGNATGSVDEEVLEQVGGQGHVSVAEVVEALHGFLVGGEQGLQKGESRDGGCQRARVNVPPGERVLVAGLSHCVMEMSWKWCLRCGYRMRGWRTDGVDPVIGSCSVQLK